MDGQRKIMGLIEEFIDKGIQQVKSVEAISAKEDSQGS